MKKRRQSLTGHIFNFFRNIERHRSGLMEQSVMVDNHRIAYLEGGSGEAVLLIHGFGGEKDNWTKFAGSLTKKYRVVALDMPGFGESTKLMAEKYDLNSQVARLNKFVAAAGFKKFHIVGNSLGGMISAEYAVKYPEQILSIGLFDSAGIKNREKSEYETLLRQGFNPLVVESAEDYDNLLKFVFATPPKVPKPIKKYLADLLTENSGMNKKIFEDILPEAMKDARFKKIKSKALIIWGDSDRVFPAANTDGMHKLVKNSEVFVIKNCGHMPMMEKPEETSKIYLEFLAKI